MSDLDRANQKPFLPEFVERAREAAAGVGASTIMAPVALSGSVRPRTWSYTP